MNSSPINPPPRRKPVIFGGMNVEASLWVLLPKAFFSILLSAVLFLIIFWLRFGELPPFAWGFALFLITMQILIITGLRFLNRPDVHTQPPARNDWIDKIGAWWLMACAFGAFFGWICGQLAVWFPDYRQFFQIAKVIFTIVLPVLTMLPNLRYISKNAAYIQVPILVLVTLLPILVGIDALITLWNTAHSH
jgi:ABC-type polysaccharide/polyol phosphate export permease